MHALPCSREEIPNIFVDKMDHISRAYTGEQAFIIANKNWMKKIIHDAGFLQSPGSVHVAFVDGDWGLLLGYENNKHKWDFFGGTNDDSENWKIKPEDAALKCLYRDAFVEELGLMPPTADKSKLNMEHLIFGYRKIGHSLLLLMRVSRFNNLRRIRENMKAKLDQKLMLSSCFTEMTDIKRIQMYCEDNINAVKYKSEYTKYVADQFEWIRDTYASLKLDSWNVVDVQAICLM